MIEVAREGHLGLVARVVRSAAAIGTAGRVQLSAAHAITAKLRHALAHGYVQQIDPRTGQPLQVHIGGYVYRASSGTPVIGFGIFKDFTASGVELWLVGIDEPYQGVGHGRAMLHELLSTPLGARTELARCAWVSDGSRRCAHLLKSCGFLPCRATPSDEWLLHSRTPHEIVERVRAMDVAGGDRAAAFH